MSGLLSRVVACRAGTKVGPRRLAGVPPIVSVFPCFRGPYVVGLGCACLILCGSALAQSSPKAALLEQAGWQALSAGQVRTAADAFRQAAEADPKSARIRLGVGMAALLDRRDDDAEAAIEQALALDPKLTRARALLGQILRRRGDLPGAIRVYEAVVAEVPDDAGAAETLERWRREAELHDRMQLAVGNHFTISFEGPEEAALATEALAVLDRAYWRICDVFSAYPLTSVPVVLYSGEQFRDITRSPSWAAGAYDGTIRVPMRGALQNPRELERVLTHEFVHALIRSLAPSGVPVWLNEGLAAALEGGEPDAPDARPGAAAPIVPLGTLPATFGGLSGRDAQAAYATSGRAARRLLDDPGGFAVAALLRDLGEGVAFEAAFSHRMQRSFADFEAALAGQ